MKPFDYRNKVDRPLIFLLVGQMVYSSIESLFFGKVAMTAPLIGVMVFSMTLSLALYISIYRGWKWGYLIEGILGGFLSFFSLAVMVLSKVTNFLPNFPISSVQLGMSFVHTIVGFYFFWRFFALNADIPPMAPPPMESGSKYPRNF